MAGVQTLRWVNDHLELIDQRVLPTRFAYVVCDSASGVADAIRAMVVRGAPAIGCAAAYGIALEARRLACESGERFLEGMERAFKVLRSSRPTAVNLFWALDRMRVVLNAVGKMSSPDIAARLLQEAHAIVAEDIAANRAMGA